MIESLICYDLGCRKRTCAVQRKPLTFLINRYIETKFNTSFHFSLHHSPLEIKMKLKLDSLKNGFSFQYSAVKRIHDALVGLRCLEIWKE
jgi:hypothetical protein